MREDINSRLSIYRNPFDDPFCSISLFSFLSPYDIASEKQKMYARFQCLQQAEHSLKERVNFLLAAQDVLEQVHALYMCQSSAKAEEECLRLQFFSTEGKSTTEGKKLSAMRSFLSFEDCQSPRSSHDFENVALSAWNSECGDAMLYATAPYEHKDITPEDSTSAKAPTFILDNILQ